MASPLIAPYGSWKSPFSAEVVASASGGAGSIVLDGEDIYWLESRPAEGGRQTLIHRRPDGQAVEMLPPPWNVRTRVHEYGGGAYTVQAGEVFFSNYADQRLYRLKPDSRDPEPITPASGYRYANGVVDARRRRLICVREDHTRTGQEAANSLVSLDITRETPGQVLVAGNDFYASPKLNPDSTRLAWLAWNHPNMPWDGCELWVAGIAPDGFLISPQKVAGGPAESIFQPEWSPDGNLFFVSDRNGWWNLYRWKEPEGEQAQEIEALAPMDAEFGEPLWGLETTRYGFTGPHQIACIFDQAGLSHLAFLDLKTCQLAEISSPYTTFSNLQARPGQVVLVAGAADRPAEVMRYDPLKGQFQALSRTHALTPDAGYISLPQELAFPTEGGLQAYALFYPPKNRDYTAPPGEKPPLLVMSHGGPTGFASTGYRARTQYWTSRGFAVVDVNYGGSSGYGRAYRQRLNGQWGIVDVDDCTNAARYLIEKGWADENRIAITGGSAGGYTTLCALIFRSLFKAGASHYGVADLEAMAKDTHKFESRYLDGMVGPYPDQAELYRARSPIHFTDRLNCPVIFFQGLEDKIVPPAQSEMMFEAVRAKGLPTAYLAFPGEQHGFRRAENIQKSMEAELYFYSRIFHFNLADPIEPVRIENL